MNSSLQRQIIESRDAFLWAVEYPPMYVSQESLDSVERELCVCSEELSAGARVRLCLGVVYAKRIHSPESYEQLVVAIEQARNKAPGDRDVRVIAEFVWCVITLTRKQEHELVLNRLEALQDELRFGQLNELYGLVRRYIASANAYLGRHGKAKEAYEDALATFRRYGMEFSYAATLNDYAVLRTRLGSYIEARGMLLEALGMFDELGVLRNRVLALTNLGIVCERLGGWASAEKYYRGAIQVFASDNGGITGFTPMRGYCMTNVESLQIMRRQFIPAEQSLREMLRTSGAELPERLRAIVYELLGELLCEQGFYEEACEAFDSAQAAMGPSLSESDVMTEVLRRKAQALYGMGHFDLARLEALRCIEISKKIGDRFELGSASRVLGEIYAAIGRHARASACLRVAIHILKGVHECYELMRAQIAYGRLRGALSDNESAEIALLEARQLAKKLELDYYQALIAIAMADVLGPQERFDEATSWISEATALRDNLEGVDRERVEVELKRSANELQVAMTRASVRAAETLKTICRVYEDARFPIAELKPDLAYQVAQSVGGESMFVIGRHGGGYRVPLTYNIAVNDAKDVVRRLDRSSKKGDILGIDGEPKVLQTPDDKTLVAVPCERWEGDKRDRTSYVLCTRFDSVVTITPRQLEILCASAEAVARLIEDEEGRQVTTPGLMDEEASRIKHPRGSFKDILTIDPEMIKVIRMAERAAGSVAPILLEGETGVGKELFARAIHGSSRRKDAAFVAVNAGGLSVHLLESELFGHVKGAFTGAQGDRVGLIETARGGTLFLDEIGEMGEELQVKLLRLLENGEYRRLGESVARQADVRIISATNRDLKKEVDRGGFRRDLFYRVSPVRLTIPPLRLRSRDIQLMVRHFLRDCAAMNGISDRYIEIDVKAMEALELYDWPGNVRELHNEILRVVSLIGKADLVKFAMLSDNIKDYLKSKSRGDGLLDRSVEQFERRLILHALEKNDWNRMRTADAVGVPRTTLLAKLKRLNVASK